MRSIRIGKDIIIRWKVTTNGEDKSLNGRKLKLVLHHSFVPEKEIPFSIDQSENNKIVTIIRGADQKSTGIYRLTLWENYGLAGQTVVDYCNAFKLVNTTCEEGGEDVEGLDTETVELEGSDIETGIPGADGMSAYELYIKHNPDSELTEEEYAEAPVHAAGAALAAIEQIEETEASVKQAEQLREQAEQVREASERTRATAEQARVTAEQQRTLAEQTRVTNESARQTAEAGRQAAETKREENTAEAIRNSESATQTAEDEADRVRTLADNPPKIVKVGGVAYWAFWDEEVQDYVVSESPAQGPQGDPGIGAEDAVRFSTQSLTTEQQAQARVNIGAVSEAVIGDINSVLDTINGEVI